MNFTTYLFLFIFCNFIKILYLTQFFLLIYKNHYLHFSVYYTKNFPPPHLHETKAIKRLFKVFSFSKRGVCHLGEKYIGIKIMVKFYRYNIQRNIQSFYLWEFISENRRQSLLINIQTRIQLRKNNA